MQHVATGGQAQRVVVRCPASGDHRAVQGHVPAHLGWRGATVNDELEGERIRRTACLVGGVAGLPIAQHEAIGSVRAIGQVGVPVELPDPILNEPILVLPAVATAVIHQQRVAAIGQADIRFVGCASTGPHHAVLVH